MEIPSLSEVLVPGRSPFPFRRCQEVAFSAEQEDGLFLASARIDVLILLVKPIIVLGKAFPSTSYYVMSCYVLLCFLSIAERSAEVFVWYLQNLVLCRKCSGLHDEHDEQSANLRISACRRRQINFALIDAE